MKTDERRTPTEAGGISLKDLWQIFLKRKELVILTAGGALVAATLIAFLTVPTYTAVGQILIEREPNILSFEDIFQIETFNDEYYQTQYKLLQSRSLAGETIDRMRLYENREFVKGLPKNGKPATGARPDADPRIRKKLIDAFLARLTIRPVRKTRLAQAGFSARDPKLASDVLNAFFDAYIEMSVEKKFQATEQATDFLAAQISAARNEIEANEGKLQEYGKEKNIVALSSTENTVIGRLGELNKALTDAQIDRINKETYYNEIRVATPDYIPDAMSNPVIQQLRQEYSRVSRDYAKQSETFLPDYPQIQGLKAELDNAKKALENETQDLIKRAYTDWQAALSREQGLAAAFANQRREAFQLNSNAIQYNSLLIQIQNQKSLLETLMKRKSETDVSSRLKGLRTSNIWVVDKAEIPTRPSKPQKAKTMFLGLLFGLFAGVALALLLENLDVSVKDAADVKKTTGLPLLGIVPSFLMDGKRKSYGEEDGGQSKPGPEKPEPVWAQLLGRFRTMAGLRRPESPSGDQDPMDLIVHFAPKSSFAEHYRSIRTSMLFTMGSSRMRTLAVMSALPQEGKTVTLCNLAVALAQVGKRVLLVDADLRKPRLHKVFGVQNLQGLTKYLISDLPQESLPHTTPIQGLYLINSGPVPPNPAELLASEKTAKLFETLKTVYDIILVDTPPLMAVSDALVVGADLDGVILVVKGGSTPREVFKEAGEMISGQQIACLGAIINNVPTRDLDDYRYRPYYG